MKKGQKAAQTATVKTVKKPRQSKKKLAILDIVSTVVGGDTQPVVEALMAEPNISEFQIAESTDYEVSQVRNILYRLHNYNLVDFLRKKDKVKGWYIYYWEFLEANAFALERQQQKEKLERLQEKLKRELSGEFYMCPNRCIRCDFDRATEHMFTCPECGTVLDKDNNQRTVEHVKSEIARLQKILN